jgi:DNA-binding NarL/FixJ family response regulator
VNALDQPPADVPPAYALEMSGDWRGAAQAWSDVGRPYEQASVLACYGTEAAQREALAIFEQLGAGAAAQDLRRRMRAIGVRKVPRGARASTRRDPHGLTRREAEILSLMSAGLRNAAIARRLFLSTRTVDHHVSAILTKLGVRSRVEAVSIAHRRAGRDV